MKILFSWIDLNTDMNKDKKTGEYGGPTLETIRQESFDHLYLFADSEIKFEKASLLKRHVEDHRKEYQVKEIFTRFMKLSNPTDHQELWEKVPAEIESILNKYVQEKPQIFINLSAGTPAMRTTWMMMVGSGQIKATALNVQRIDPSKETTIDKVDVGIYPFVSQLKQKVDAQLNIPQAFKSQQMQLIMRRLSLITGDLNMPIMLLGETGTGKTTIAKLYHLMTGAPKEKFYHFVCGEFDVGDLNTIKSQLFGHIKGAFTGADKDQDGALLNADGGTLFLDEIGDIPPRVQRLLINAVEKKEFRLFGSNDLIQSDFRLICATNRDVKEMLKSGELSQDFYNRIRSCEFEIPPLRDRKEDIPAIINDLLQTDANYQNLTFSEGILDLAVKKIRHLSLPGNIRDMQRILDHLTIQANQPKPHAITAKEVEAYFDEISEPSQNDEFMQLIHRLLQIWPQTIYAYKNYKWQEALTEVALRKLATDMNYKKKNGDLNINRISNFLGIDNKTIKSRLRSMDNLEADI
jgi:DNA-binding NtrC family response regulator